MEKVHVLLPLLKQMYERIVSTKGLQHRADSLCRVGKLLFPWQEYNSKMVRPVPVKPCSRGDEDVFPLQKPKRKRMIIKSRIQTQLHLWKYVKACSGLADT